MGGAREHGRKGCSTERFGDADLRSLQSLAETFGADDVDDHFGDYSDTNIRFHQAIIELGGCPMLGDIANGLLRHVQAIRQRTIFEIDRARRSVAEHAEIVGALQRRDADLAARLVREQTLRLRSHVAQFVDLN